MKNYLLQVKKILLIVFVAACVILNPGNMYGQVFDQTFAGANIAPVSTSSTTIPATITNTDYYTSTNTASRFTNIAIGGGSGISMNINNVVGGEFNVADGANGNWILSRTADIASPAPTAVRVTFNARFDVNSTGAAGRLLFQFGSGFSDTWNHGTVGAMKESDANTFAGIIFRSSNSTSGATIFRNNNTTQIGATQIGEAYNTWTLVLNNTGASLGYTAPGGGSVTVADNAFDLYIGTTLWGDDLPAAGASAGLTDFKFATNSNSSAGRINFFLQDFRVDDISPVSCSTPTLSGAAQSATVCAGSTAVINLTGLLPNVTNNTIEYSINGVPQTPVTGVNSNGSGNASFTTAVLNAGNDGQTLQVTKIIKQTCEATFAQNVTLAVNATSNGGTTTYNGSDVCAGDLPSGTITVAGITGTVTKWQKSPVSNFSSGVVDITNTTTTLTAAEVGAVSVNTYIRAVVTNGVCPAANTASPSLITVNALPAISGQPTTTPANYPEGFGSPAPISVTATGAGVAYQWYSSTDAVTNTLGDDIALGTNSSETPSTAVQGTLYYYCVVSGTCSPSVTSNISGAVNILPSCTNPTFSVDPTDGQSECVGGTLTLGTVVADQSPTYQWFSNATLSNTGGTSVGSGNGGNTDTYTPPSATPGIYFYYVVATSGACSTPSIPVQITVNATAIASQSTPGATYSLNASAAALTVTPQPYSAGLSYQWYSSTDAATNTPGDDLTVGTNSNSYTPLTTTVGTLYYYVVVSGNCTPSSATSDVSGAISVVQYVTGDYVSTASGSWETVGTWSTWNGSSLVPAGVIPNSSTVNVYINGGFTVTYPTTDRAVNNLYVLNGTLKTNTVITGANRRYIFVHGTTVEVGPNGTLGSALTGDNADAISIELKNTGTVTFSGSGGLANFCLIRYSNTSEVIIDRDITLNYHGSAFAGNAMAYHSIGTITNDHTLTINAGKTLTFAPWACYSATGSAGVLAAVNLYIIVNGTLTMQAYPTYYTGARGYMSTGVGAGKIFYLYIESTGTVNLREFWPNGTSGNGDPGFVEIMPGGELNVANVTDLRNTGNAIYGDGAFNVNNGATLRLRDPLGITAAPAAAGAIQTGVRSFSSGASYTYEAVLGSQVTGDGLPSSVRYLTINNTSGVTLTNSVTVDSALVLTNGKLATGSNTVSVAATGNSLTGASATNYVDGNLQRAVATGASTVAFPVGDAANYTPVSLAFGAGNTAGNVTARTDVPGVAPAAGFAPTGSGISQTKYINRSWTLTSTISTPQYGATFTYINPGDVVGGANTGALIVAKDDAGTWSNPGVASSVAPSVATVSGLTSFSVFHLGEDGCDPVSIGSASAFPAGPLCSGQTTDLTANSVAGTNAVVTWYTGPNGTGTNLGTGTTLNGVGANTYYARVTGQCGTPQEASVTVGSIGNTFTGTGNWSDNARWSCGVPPSSGDAVIIASGANATLDVNFTVSGSLTMTATSTLIVNPTRTLSVDVAATANFNGQSVTFKSDNTGTASLGQVNGTLSGATNVTVERFIPANTFRSWRLLSVPVTTSQTIRQAWQEGDANPNPKDNNVAGYGTQITGVFGTQAAATAAGFDSTSVQAGMLRWNGASWSNITSTNQAINNFNSYFLYIRGDRSLSVTGSVNSSNATTLRTRGTVFTGDQTTNVGASAFALVPNLYPSAINFTGLTRTGGVNNLFYIWDSKKLNGSSLGVYQTFSNTNSFNCLISGGSYTLGQPNTTIESGQSFFVTSGAAGTIVLKETAKISGTNGSLGFRPTPSAVKATIGTRLYNSNDEMLDANTVVFDAVYSKAVADEDAPKMGNPGANFAIETGSKLLAIEGTAPVKENDAIQFRMWNMAAGNYKLEFAISNLSLPAGTEAILEDSYTKANTVLNTSVATNVNFTVDASPASSAANRFRIVIGKAANSSNKAGFTIAPNPIEGNTMNLAFSQQAAGQYNVRIVSANGQAMSTYRLMHAGGNANQVINLPAVMGNGTYTVEIVSPDKARTVKTVLVSKK